MELFDKKKPSVTEDCVLEEGKGKMRLSTTLFSSLRLTGKKNNKLMKVIFNFC